MKIYKKQKVFLHAASFISFSFIGIIIFYGWAFGIVLKKSFITYDGIWGIDNYLIVLKSKVFWLAMKNTVCYIGISIPLLLIISLGIALVLQKKLFVNQVIKKGLLIPLAIPASAVVFVWNLLFDTHGILNGFVTKFGINEIYWLDGKWSFCVLVFIYLWKNLGYYTILWLVALAQIPQVTYEAASMEGAKNWQVFLYITLPQLKKSSYYIILFSIMSGFKIFQEIHIIAGDYPDNEIYMMQHLLNNWYRDMEIEKFSAASMLLMVLIVMGVLLIRWGLKENTGRNRDV